jgi:hypothetical protein
VFPGTPLKDYLRLPETLLLSGKSTEISELIIEVVSKIDF